MDVGTFSLIALLCITYLIYRTSNLPADGRLNTNGDRRGPGLGSALYQIWRNARTDHISISRISAHEGAANGSEASSPARLFDYSLSIALGFALLIAKHLGFSPRLGKVREDGTLEVPDLSYISGLDVDEAEVELYEASISKQDNASAPSAGGTSDRMVSTRNPLLLLAPVTTPMLTSLLMKRSSPMRPIGSVNVRNTFIFHRPAACMELLSGRLGGSGELIAEARMGGELKGRRVKRGIEFDSVITVTQSASDDSTGKLGSGSEARRVKLFEFVFTTLAMLRLPPNTPYHSLSGPGAAASAKNVEMTAAPPITEAEEEWWEDPEPLRIPNDAPTLWARLSKDYNPIHMSPTMAKAFGFKRKIAHGNLVLAMVIQRAVDNGSKVPEAGGSDMRVLGEMWSGEGIGAEASWTTVEFKRPVFVPGTVRIRWSRRGHAVSEGSGRKGAGGRVQVYEITRGGEKGEVRLLVDIRAGPGSEPHNRD